MFQRQPAVNTDFLKRFQGRISIVKKDGEHGTEKELAAKPHKLYRLEEVPEEEDKDEIFHEEELDIEKSPADDDDEPMDESSFDDAEETLRSAISLLTSSSKGSLESLNDVNRSDSNIKRTDCQREEIKEVGAGINQLEHLSSWDSLIAVSQNEKVVPAKPSKATNNLHPRPPTIPKPFSASIRNNRYSKIPISSSQASVYTISSRVSSSDPSIMRPHVIQHHSKQHQITTKYEDHGEYSANSDEYPVVSCYSDLYRRSSPEQPSLQYHKFDSYSQQFKHREKEVFENLKSDLKMKEFAAKVRHVNKVKILKSKILEPRIDPDEVRRREEMEKLTKRLEYGRRIKLPPMKRGKDDEIPKQQKIRSNRDDDLEKRYYEKKKEVDEIRREFMLFYST